MQERLEQELKSVQKYRKYWNHIKKRDAQADEQTKTKWVLNGTGTYTLVPNFILHHSVTKCKLLEIKHPEYKKSHSKTCPSITQSQQRTGFS